MLTHSFGIHSVSFRLLTLAVGGYACVAIFFLFGGFFELVKRVNPEKRGKALVKMFIWISFMAFCTGIYLSCLRLL